MSDKTDQTSGVPITIWGPSLWQAIHALSYSHPAACQSDCEKKKGMYDFLKSLTKVIPCEECRGHYTTWFNENMKQGENSDILTSRDKLTKALHELHNDVNRRTNKPELKLETVRAKYETGSSKCPMKGQSDRNLIIVISVLVGVIAIVTGGIVYKRYKKR